MYVKVVQDTLKIHLCKAYCTWAAECEMTDVKFAGYKIFTDSGSVIDNTMSARDSYSYFTEYLAVIGTSKQGLLAIDYSGNLDNCGKQLRRLDKNVNDFLERVTSGEYA